MTGAELKTMFETIVDDTMDDIQFYIFLNAAKNTIEASRDWNFNRAYDNSETIAANETFLSTHALPTRFLAPRKLYTQDDRIPWVNIPFEERERYRDTYKRYYIDWLNSTYSLCGASGASGKTINFYYAQSTADIAAGTSPVWPTMFHPLIAFKTAEMWASGSDSDDLNFRMSRENLRLSGEILKSMILWDAKIKTIEYNDKNARNIDLDSYPNVVGGEFTY